MASSKVVDFRPIPQIEQLLTHLSALQDCQHSSKAISQQRLAMTTYSGSSLPARQSHVRNHSHTISASTFNSNNRITRRKSVSSTAATNSVAIAAAVKEMNDGTVSAMSVPLSSSRRSTTSRTPSAKSGPLSNYPTPPSSLPSHRSTASSSSRKPERSESAIDDDQNEGDEFEDRANPGFDSTRTRRASEGQYLKGGGKKYHGGELKCDKCGKGYKHSSCLSKHLCVPISFLCTLSLNPSFVL